MNRVFLMALICLAAIGCKKKSPDYTTIPSSVSPHTFRGTYYLYDSAYSITAIPGYDTPKHYTINRLLFVAMDSVNNYITLGMQRFSFYDSSDHVYPSGYYNYKDKPSSFMYNKVVLTGDSIKLFAVEEKGVYRIATALSVGYKL